MRIDGIQRPKRLQGHIALLAIVLFVVACVPQTRWDYTPNKSHIVRSGETLFTIAFRYGHDHRELARWNNLGDGSLIYPGQVIRLTPEAGTSSARAPAGPAPTPRRTVPPPPSDPSPDWAWPANGRVNAEFDGNPGSGTGLLIAGRAGQPVRAAAAGRVVYSGGGLIGYGQLIILKHNDTYLSAYGHNASLLVQEGDKRRNGKPVNPRQFLPAR
jgi:lipoprotein NlpD